MSGAREADSFAAFASARPRGRTKTCTLCSMGPEVAADFEDAARLIRGGRPPTVATMTEWLRTRRGYTLSSETVKRHAVVCLGWKGWLEPPPEPGPAK